MMMDVLRSLGLHGIAILILHILSFLVLFALFLLFPPFALFLLLVKILVDLFLLFQVHLLHFSTDIVPFRASSGINELSEVSLPHPVAFFSQEMQQIDYVVGACLVKNQSLHFSLLLADFAAHLSHVLFVPFRLYLFEFLRKAFFLLIEEINDFRLDESLIAFLGCSLAKHCVQIAFRYPVGYCGEFPDQGVLGAKISMYFFVQVALQMNRRLIRLFWLLQRERAILIIAEREHSIPIGIFILSIVKAPLSSLAYAHKHMISFVVNARQLFL